MDLIKRKPKEDFGTRHLARLIRFQSFFFIGLILIILIVVAIKGGYVKLPNQDALEDAPPFEEQSIQYQIFAYQDNRYLKHETKLAKDRVLLVGQVYDYKTVQSMWPDFEFYVNKQRVPVPKDSGAFSLDFFLKPGKNTFDTYVRAGGEDLNRQQLILYYQSTSTHS